MGAAGLDVYFNVFTIPPGVPEWTKYAFGSVGLMLAILGMNFALQPSNTVRMIRVLPTAAETSSKSTGAYKAPPKVRVEVVSRRKSPIPFVSLRKEIVEPRDIVLKAKMYDPKPPATQLERMRMKQEWAERKKAQKEYDDQHRMTIPFRDAKWAAGTIFGSIRRGLTGEGFVPIHVNGSRYKLDMTNGYVFEEGRALDRVARIEPEEQRPSLLHHKS